MTQPVSSSRAPRGRRPEPRRMPPDHVGVLIGSTSLTIIGWAGLFWLMQTPPGLGPEIWLFFVLLHLAVTGTVLPLVRYASVRFTRPGQLPPPGGVIVRQSVWVGLYVVICAWLQIPRVLSVPVAFFLALVFIILEAFLRAREVNAEE